MALRPASTEKNGSRRFGWRDALAFVRAVPNMAWRRDQRVSWQSFARLSAIDTRQLPPQRYFRVSDGGRIAYRSYGEAGAAQLVLIHGSACFGDQLSRLARHLASNGPVQVHTLDLRGHGASSEITDCPEQFCRDIGEFIVALRGQNSQSTILLGGHSAGGGLVLNALSSHWVEGVSGGLLLAPFLGIDSKTVRPLFGSWLSHVHLRRLAGVILANLCGITRFNRVPVAKFNLDASLHDPRFAREWPFSAVFGFGPGPIEADPSAPATPPLRLIAGDRDECFRSEFYPEEAERLAPGTETVILPGLGHWDVLSNNAALDACASWLQTHVPKAADLVTGKEQTRHARTG